MNPASVENFAHIHAAKEKTADGSRIYSRIGIVIQDYSKGTGDNCVRVKASLKPEEIKYFYDIIRKFPPTFNYPGLNDDGQPSYQTKIFGKPDKNNRAKVTMFRLSRQHTDANGEIRKSPWIFEIKNGSGEKVGTKNGGFYMKGKSFQVDDRGESYIYMSDYDFHANICKVAQYINIWEIAMGAPLIKLGRKALEEYYADLKNNAA